MLVVAMFTESEAKTTKLCVFVSRMLLCRANTLVTPTKRVFVFLCSESVCVFFFISMLDTRTSAV